MSDSWFQQMPGLRDDRKLVVNGKKYLIKTANKCTTCSSENYYYVRMKIEGGQSILECAVCDSSITLRDEMVDIP